MFKKMILLRNLHGFSKRFPQTRIIGGPRFLRFFCPRRIDRWSGFYSQAGLDAFICSYFFKSLSQDWFPKVFIDIGCNHPTKHNNSCFFEKYMGFRVVAIDALNACRAEWAKTRPESDFVGTAVGNRAGTVEFEVADGNEDGADMFSSVAGASNKHERLNRKRIEVEMKTIDAILSERSIESVGIMSHRGV